MATEVFRKKGQGPGISAALLTQTKPVPKRPGRFKWIHPIFTIEIYNSTHFSISTRGNKDKYFL